MLREDQIQRYSRHVLLKEVGGRGQRRLLDAVVLVEGQSEALDVAVASLGVSGTPIRGAAGLERTGFLAGASLEALSPDAVADAHRAVAGWLGPLSGGPGAPLDCFRVGLAAGVIVGVPANTAWPLDAPLGEPSEPVTTGALAALVIQRFALALDGSPVMLRWSGGRWQRL